MRPRALGMHVRLLMSTCRVMLCRVRMMMCGRLMMVGRALVMRGAAAFAGRPTPILWIPGRESSLTVLSHVLLLRVVVCLLHDN